MSGTLRKPSSTPKSVVLAAILSPTLCSSCSLDGLSDASEIAGAPAGAAGGDTTRGYDHIGDDSIGNLASDMDGLSSASDPSNHSDVDCLSDGSGYAKLRHGKAEARVAHAGPALARKKKDFSAWVQGACVNRQERFKVKRKLQELEKQADERAESAQAKLAAVAGVWNQSELRQGCRLVAEERPLKRHQEVWAHPKQWTFEGTVPLAFSLVSSKPSDRVRKTAER